MEPVESTGELDYYNQYPAHSPWLSSRNTHVKLLFPVQGLLAQPDTGSAAAIFFDENHPGRLKGSLKPIYSFVRHALPSSCFKPLHGW